MLTAESLHGTDVGVGAQIEQLEGPPPGGFNLSSYLLHAVETYDLNNYQDGVNVNLMGVFPYVSFVYEDKTTTVDKWGTGRLE